MMILNRVICGDALEEMKKFPDAAFDLVVTSPPYNIRNSTGGGFKSGGGKWKSASLIKGYGSDNNVDEDNKPYGEYVQWQRECLREMLRLVPDTGAVFYNHKWRVQAGLLQDRHEIVEGFPVRQIIIWQRAGGINFNSGYFLPTYEVIYLIAKKDFRLKQETLSFTDVWTISQENNNPHPAAFPLAIPERIIFATEAQKILDPFAGSGTTCLAAVNLGRQFVGIEKNKQYCQWAIQRLQREAKPTNCGSITRFSGQTSFQFNS